MLITTNKSKVLICSRKIDILLKFLKGSIRTLTQYTKWMFCILSSQEYSLLSTILFDSKKYSRYSDSRIDHFIDLLSMSILEIGGINNYWISGAQHLGNKMVQCRIGFSVFFLSAVSFPKDSIRNILSRENGKAIFLVKI